MGRKSSAKAQSRAPAGAAPPPVEPRGFNPLLIVGFVAVLAVVGLFAYSRSGSPQGSQQASTSAPPQASTPAVADVPAAAKRGPHKQENLPPLPFNPSPPARPADVVRAAYQFAAEHPEVLSYVPCYCGCERSGHRGNEDCFVTARAADGDVTEWEPHGMT